MTCPTGTGKMIVANWIQSFINRLFGRQHASPMQTRYEDANDGQIYINDAVGTAGAVHAAILAAEFTSVIQADITALTNAADLSTDLAEASRTNTLRFLDENSVNIITATCIDVGVDAAISVAGSVLKTVRKDHKKEAAANITLMIKNVAYAANAAENLKIAEEISVAGKLAAQTASNLADVAVVADGKVTEEHGKDVILNDLVREFAVADNRAARATGAAVLAMANNFPIDGKTEKDVVLIMIEKALDANAQADAVISDKSTDPGSMPRRTAVLALSCAAITMQAGNLIHQIVTRE